MITTDGPAPDTPVLQSPLQVSELTVVWMLKRSSLWAAIVFVAVVSACLLYGAASKAGQVPRQTLTFATKDLSFKSLVL